MEIRKVIRRMLNGEEATLEEKKEVFSYLNHVPNYFKSEEEWELYLIMAKEAGYPKPDRNTRIRPLHDKAVIAAYTKRREKN